jgi:predicted flavoprotein YhiN
MSDFISRFSAEGYFLYQKFPQFTTDDPVEFLAGLVAKTITERRGDNYPW